MPAAPSSTGSRLTALNAVVGLDLDAVEDGGRNVERAGEGIGAARGAYPRAPPR